MLSGRLLLDDLDLGALANVLPGVAFSESPPDGRVTAEVYIDELPLAEPALSEVRAFLQSGELILDGHHFTSGLLREPIVLSGDALRIPTMPVDVRLSNSLRFRLFAGGRIEELSQSPSLGLSVDLDPVDLSRLEVDLPRVERARGTLTAHLDIEGPTDLPRLSGSAKLDHGLMRIKGLALPLDDIAVDVRIRNGEVDVRRATARAGNTGELSLNARIPLRGLDIAEASATLVARDVKLPVAEGVKLTADAMLKATYQPSLDESVRSLPNITGTVSLTQFSYTRPMAFRVDLEQLTGRGRTVVDTYDPDEDLLTFDINLVSPRPLRITNNLIDTRLDLAPPGVRVAGSDQRYGAVGTMQLDTGAKIFLQGHTFSVRDGKVRFDNLSRIAPKLDVLAETEYRRYATSADAEAGTAGDTATAASTAGKWRIIMHATGDTDSPQVRFTSDPPLSQDDIVLLLQVGMTRAELDRGLATSLVQSAGLEALSAVTGLDQAVRKTVPLIDEFRIGSQYSSRTGRPEPTVSIGKRITDDVRATVTSSLAENREVRSNIEWKLSRGVSVQGSYDNVNDVSSSILGNVGVDLRWRLEFE